MNDSDSIFDHLAEQIGGAFCTAIIVPAGGTPDIRFTLELGMALLYDKPLILAVEPGAQVPAKLASVADEIVEMDMTDKKRAEASIHRAVERLLDRMGKE